MDEYNIDDAIDKLYKDSKKNETVYCPRCGNIIMVQRSKDWSRLYAAYCQECGFGVKFTYSLK